MKSLRWLAGLVLALLTAPVFAQPAAPQISLLTFAPGPVYWEHYGHNALMVSEGGAEPLVFNYGVFDFRQKNFFLNFARGRMLYRVIAQPLGEVLEQYREEGRWVRQQQLNLSPEQARALRDFLAWNIRPENTEYRYDYFIDNCSTRVRDALNQVLGGELRRQLESQATGRDYRFEADRHMAPDLALMLGMDAALGSSGDLPINRWQQSFLPRTLMQALSTLRLADGKPLVLRERVLLDGGEVVIPESPPALLLPLLALGLLLGAGLLLLPGRSFALLALPLSLIGAIGGVILLLFWGVTDHWPMKSNFNLLLFSPLSLLLLPASAGKVGSRAGFVATLIAAGALLALLLQMLAQHQQQLHWIALWLPVHFALAWRLRNKIAAR